MKRAEEMTEVQGDGDKESKGEKRTVWIISDQVQIGHVVITLRQESREERSEMRGERDGGYVREEQKREQLLYFIMVILK